MNISLIIPCYNEEANIQKGVLDKIGNFTKYNNDFKEVLIVDDGSSDLSRKLIKQEYLYQFAKFKIIENHHQGKAFAITSGINKAAGDVVMFSDIDLATPIEEANKLGADAIVAVRFSATEVMPSTAEILAYGTAVKIKK